MKNNIVFGILGLRSIDMIRLLAVLSLFCAWNAQATAPRITPQFFGEEKKADIVGYQLAPQDAAAKSDNETAAEIVTAVFQAAGKAVTLDMLPSKQLAVYALVNYESAALIGSRRDVPEKDKGQYRTVAFYLGVSAPSDEPLMLIFTKKHARANELHQAFNEGLQKLVKSGKYLEILEKHYGKDHIPADYFTRLQRHNSGLK